MIGTDNNNEIDKDKSLLIYQNALKIFLCSTSRVQEEAGNKLVQQKMNRIYPNLKIIIVRNSASINVLIVI